MLWKGTNRQFGTVSEVSITSVAVLRGDGLGPLNEIPL